MVENNYYKDNINEHLKGFVTINNGDYFSELTIGDEGIKIRLLNFSTKNNNAAPEIISLDSIVFKRANYHYLLFGLALIDLAFIRIGSDGDVRDYEFSAQGFLYSKTVVNQNDFFTSISIYGESIKKWSGSTRKLNKIMSGGIANKLPCKDDCVEFETSITSVGTIGLRYSFKYGGLNGLHTVGMNVEPHVTITFEEGIGLDKLIDNYIDLYMILRFFIGNSLMISNVKIQSYSRYGRNDIQFYMAEKKEDERNNHAGGMLLSYATIYNDDSEDDFPDSVWENYFNPRNRENKELIKKFVTYSMVKNNEEKFLGYYRIIEAMTVKESFYVDEDKLSNLLKRAKPLLVKYLSCTSLSDFFRAIKNTNKSRSNTESCIHHFIQNLPHSVLEKTTIKEIKISEICKSRNQIIHQPLFSETPEKIYKHMQTIELLIKLATLIRLGVSTKKIEESINHLP